MMVKTLVLMLKETLTTIDIGSTRKHKMLCNIKGELIKYRQDEPNVIHQTNEKSVDVIIEEYIPGIGMKVIFKFDHIVSELLTDEENDNSISNRLLLELFSCGIFYMGDLTQKLIKEGKIK